VPGPQGETPYSDLEGTEIDAIHVGLGPQWLVMTPDGSRMLVLNHELERDTLAVIDPDAACKGDAPVDTGCVGELEARPLHDRLVLSPDSRFALSYISSEAAYSGAEEVINLNEVGVYDLQQPTVRFATVGFNPQSFAFTRDPDAPRVVALTSNKVVALDLLTGEDVPRELTLGTDTQLEPQEVVISSDDHFALVTVAGSADLFTFDLTQETLPINILSLSGVPESMALSGAGDETLILVDDGYELNIVHHEDFRIDVHPLEDSVNAMRMSPDGRFAVLYDADGLGRFMYYVDMEADRVQAYLLDNPCQDVRVSPDGQALVIFYVPDPWTQQDALDAHHAVAILNLAQGDREPNPILISSAPQGAAFAMGGTPERDDVFVPFDGVDHGLVGRFNLYTYDSKVVETPLWPRSVGVLEADGRVVVVHSVASGMISIFPEDAPERIQFIHGFMIQDIF